MYGLTNSGTIRRTRHTPHSDRAQILASGGRGRRASSRRLLLSPPSALQVSEAERLLSSPRTPRALDASFAASAGSAANYSTHTPAAAGTGENERAAANLRNRVSELGTSIEERALAISSCAAFVQKRDSGGELLLQLKNEHKNAAEILFVCLQGVVGGGLDAFKQSASTGNAFRLQIQPQLKDLDTAHAKIQEQEGANDALDLDIVESNGLTKSIGSTIRSHVQFIQHLQDDYASRGQSECFLGLFLKFCRHMPNSAVGEKICHEVYGVDLGSKEHDLFLMQRGEEYDDDDLGDDSLFVFKHAEVKDFVPLLQSMLFERHPDNKKVVKFHALHAPFGRAEIIGINLNKPMVKAMIDYALDTGLADNPAHIEHCNRPIEELEAKYENHVLASLTAGSKPDLTLGYKDGERTAAYAKMKKGELLDKLFFMLQIEATEEEDDDDDDDE